MTETVTTSGPRRAWWLTFTLLAGPIIWVAHQQISYILVSLACKFGFVNVYLLGISLLSILIAALTLVAIAIVLYAGWLAWRDWSFGDDTPPADNSPRGIRHFFGIGGVFLSGLFTLTIIFAAIPAFVLNPCLGAP